MLKMLFSVADLRTAAGERICPVVVCDVCHQVIDDARNGVAVYRVGDEGEHNIGDHLDVYHVCKGECADVAQCRYDYNGWDELTDHLACLLRNVRPLPEGLKDAESRSDAEHLIRMAGTVERHGMTPALLRASLAGMREVCRTVPPAVLVRAAATIPASVRTAGDLVAHLRGLAGDLFAKERRNA